MITPIFNPFNFRSRYRLYNDFAKHMKDSGANLFTVEAAFGDNPFAVTDANNPWHLQLRTDQILWHKERLINLAYRELLHRVPDTRFIAWIDADVTFLNPNWVAETLQALTYLQVVQPFGEAINLNNQEQYMWNCPSSFRAFIDGRGYHQHPSIPLPYLYKGHPGLAWAATREAMDAMGGLYDVCIAGSADTVMGNAFKGDFSIYLPGSPSQALMDSMDSWQKTAQATVRNRIGYVRGALAHHWHGASGNRGYEKRWDIMSFHQFDPTQDIVTDANGMHRWAGNKPQLEDDFRLSLASRKEDDCG